jgi:hypothetical protein
MNLPNCLSRIIGSRKTEWNLPSDFGLYIEQLPMVSQVELIAIRTPDYANDADYVQDMINFSMSNIVSNLSQWLIQSFRQNSILDRVKIGKLPKDGAITYNTVNPSNRGIKIYNVRQDTFGIINVGAVRFLCNTNGSVTLTITDNVGNSQTYTETAVAGQILEFHTAFSTDGNLVTVTVDNTAIATANIEVAECCGRNYRMSNSEFFRVEGYDGSSTAVNNTFGIMADITYQCDQKLIACLFRNSVAFQQACLYRFGVDYCDQVATTTRKNPMTIHRTDEDIDLQRGKFEVQLNQSLEMIRVEAQRMLRNPKTPCISCNGTRYVQ